MFDGVAVNPLRGIIFDIKWKEDLEWLLRPVTMYYWVNYARFITCLLSLSMASVYDIKTREVPDEIWILFAPISVALTVTSLFLGGWRQEAILSLAISLMVMSALSTALFYIGLFGGADAKALIYLAAAMPEHPNFSPAGLPLGLSAQRLIILPPISTFSNAALIASLSIIGIVLRNLVDLARNKRIFVGLEHERLIAKIGAFLIGYRVDADKVRAKRDHYLPLEEFGKHEDGSIKRKLKIFRRLSWDGDEIGMDVPAGIHGKIWVTPGLPFLLFITVGFITAIFIGDIILLLVGFMLAPGFGENFLGWALMSNAALVFP